jgi:hypothetical protein
MHSVAGLGEGQGGLDPSLTLDLLHQTKNVISETLEIVGYILEPPKDS